MMKKILSLTLALMTMIAMSVTAFAAVDSIAFEADESGINLHQSLLSPGITYKFPVLIAKDGSVNSDLTTQDMEGHRFDIKITQGNSAISAPKIVEEEGKYYLTFTTTGSHSAQATPVALQVRYLRSSPLEEVASTQMNFSVGYTTISDTLLAGLIKGDILEIPAATPVLNAEQIELLAKINDYEAVTFAYGDWTYTGKINNLNGLNLYSTQASIPEIAQKHSENQFKFLSFLGKPKFEERGLLTIDVSDIAHDFGGQFFLYKYQDRRLYKLNFTYDENSGTISFRPSDLGRYAITDKEITDLTLNGSGSIIGSGSSHPTSSPSGDEVNPPTGASEGLGLIAVFSLAAIVLTLAPKKH